MNPAENRSNVRETHPEQFAELFSLLHTLMDRSSTMCQKTTTSTSPKLRYTMMDQIGELLLDGSPNSVEVFCLAARYYDAWLSVTEVSNSSAYGLSSRRLAAYACAGLALKFLHGEDGDELEKSLVVPNTFYYEFFNEHHTFFEVSLFEKVDPRLEETLSDQELVTYHTENNRLYKIPLSLERAYVPLQEQVLRELKYELFTTTVYDMVSCMFHYTCTKKELDDPFFMRAAEALIGSMCTLCTLQCSPISADLMLRIAFQACFYIRISMGMAHTHASTVLAVTMLHFNLSFHDVVYMDGITLWPCVFRNSLRSKTFVALRLLFGRVLIDKFYFQMCDHVDQNSKTQKNTKKPAAASLAKRVLLGRKRRKHLNTPAASSSPSTTTTASAESSRKKPRSIESSSLPSSVATPQSHETLLPQHVFSSLMEDVGGCCEPLPPLPLDLCSLKPIEHFDSRMSELDFDAALEQTIDSFGDHHFVDAPLLSSLMVSEEEAAEIRQEMIYSCAEEQQQEKALLRTTSSSSSREETPKTRLACIRHLASSATTTESAQRSPRVSSPANPADVEFLQWCSQSIA